MSDIKILVVEDEPDVCAALQSFLGRRGYEVTTTPSGAEALKLIGAIAPDLVLLDISLDEMNGLDALKELRLKDPRTRIIVITGQTYNDDQPLDATGIGVMEVLHKPISLSRLEELVVKGIGGEVAATLLPERAAGTLPAAALDVHKVTNLLGIIRNLCETYVLDADEGLYPDRSADEMKAESTRVMRAVIENVDRIMLRLEKVR
ncbi:MAG: response regulator [Candidatus Omnitrophica bacterium]|nr:response regulator [Candidatus Omnitrophota bacterium]